jgi:hypothetical protein
LWVTVCAIGQQQAVQGFLAYENIALPSSGPKSKPASVCCLLRAGFLLDLEFSPENGGKHLSRNGLHGIMYRVFEEVTPHMIPQVCPTVGVPYLPADTPEVQLAVSVDGS